jgi:hypothetical protein
MSRSPSPSRTASSLGRLLRAELAPGSWWLCRILFLRCIAFVFVVAFAVALNQNPALLGDEGLLPARDYMQRLRSQLGSKNTLASAWAGFMKVPSLLWFFAPGQEETLLTVFATVGVMLSACVCVRGAANVSTQCIPSALQRAVFLPVAWQQ